MQQQVIRKGATSLKAVPSDVLELLAAGRIETVNLMEWLAADMSALATNVAREAPALADALAEAAAKMAGQGVTGRLQVAGSAIATATGARGRDFEALASHRCDIVRQWACYAANDPSVRMAVDARLAATLRFADDGNMSVRETAWMAFRPHLPAEPARMLALLLPLTANPSENVRRFAVEVTRPRSVWGAHLPHLKRDPGSGAAILDAVIGDTSRYVRLAAGNWLNDASKTRPDWVAGYCARWENSDNAHTRFIVKRGSRSMGAGRGEPRAAGLLDAAVGEAA